MLYGGRDSLPQATARELERLRPQRVVLVGSTRVLSDGLRDTVRELVGVAVERTGGPDRFATAAVVARDAFDSRAPAVYLANGSALADGLAGSVAAGRRGGPLLLVRRSGLPEVTVEALRACGPREVVVVGDDRVVSGRWWTRWRA